ncbi:MAG: hypothetical protein K0Q79_3728 [Flavipsychrobacter sp.]|jgi:hypothetical protein|nr:hypothetical protein [Flavipsychrobacter sp.]
MYYKSHPSAIDRNNSFAIKIEDLVREIVIQNEIPYYRIESGVDLSTAEGSEEGYMPVIRIITYFEDTVNKISHILHDEFNVDIERSTDKKKIRIETFAYKNINYTATLNTTRQQQTEYKRAGNKKFEIQICSMLQDAWSGIEKELGYDNTAMPDEAKRDFYRVGALLEMADIEFLKIRTEHGKRSGSKPEEITHKHTEPAKQQAPQPVAEQPANTFADYLQAVVKETPAPVAEPTPVFNPPVQEAPKVMPQVAVPEVKAEVAPPPPPVVQAPPPPVVQAPVAAPVVQAPPPPVVQAPPVAAPVAQAPPPPVVQAPPPQVQQPVVEVPRVAAEAQVPKTLNIGVPQPIAPQRPQAPAGIAPKPAVVPPADTTNNLAASNNINIENLKELAQSINQAEHKISAAVPPPPPPPVVQAPQVVKQEPQPQPTIVIPIPPPAAETLKPSPSPEVIVPGIETVVTDPQAPVVPAVAATASNLNVNGNGMIEKATEVIRESTLDKTIPFYNETAKPAKTTQVDENAQMTDVTLRDYVMNSKVLKEIDQMIAERAGAKINSDIDIEGDVERLRFLKVYTLKQLHERLTDNKNDIVAFAEKWIGKDNGGSFDSGISLFYLEYLLVGKKNDPAFAVEYVVKFISDNDYSARYIIPTYNSIHNTEAPNFSHLTLKA